MDGSQSITTTSCITNNGAVPTTMAASIGSNSDMQQASTTLFMDSNSGEKIILGNDPGDMCSLDHLGQTDIDKFFARPIRVATYTWTSTWSPITLNIWNSYLNTTVVKNKLLNYAYLRGKLHIKILVNSAPFNYGALQVAYFPYDFDQSSIGYGIDSFGKTTSVPSNLRVYLQNTLPHIVVDASKSEGGEIIAPFIYDRNWLELKKSVAAQRMGTLSMRTLVPLASSNGATPSVTVSIYAWMEDVQLTGTTGVTVLQSDAYGSGPISKPASVVANIASKLSNAPIIGPYARATNIAASAVGRIASMFGYSNIPLIAPIHNYRNTGIGNCASAEIGSHIEKLSLDPKNEITIDYKTLGATKDDMLLENIYTRKGLISVFTVSDAVNVDQSVFQSRVSPQYNVSDTSVVYIPPITHCAGAFGYWRGDIIYTLRAIKTPYHKGRFRLAWDTLDIPIRTASSTLTTLNTVWDISEQDEIEFCVPYQNETAFLPLNPNIEDTNFSTTLDDNTITDDAKSNGVFSVTLINEVSGPLTTTDIKILVYVRGAPNMAFAAPVDIWANTTIGQYSFLQPQTDVVQFRDATKEPPEMYSLHHGEIIKSIKVLLYRTNYYTHYNKASAGGVTLNSFSIPRVPTHYGYDLNGLHTARNQANTSNIGFNWVNITPYHYFAVAFIFERGGHNYRIFNDSSYFVSAKRYTVPIVTTTANNNWCQDTEVLMTERNNIVSNRRNLCGGAGATLGNPHVNSIIEVCSPFYSQYRAVPTCPYMSRQPPGSYSSFVANINFPVGEECAITGANRECVTITYGSTAESLTDRFTIFHSVGVDFSLIYYRGCPAIYKYTTVPLVAT